MEGKTRSDNTEQIIFNGILVTKITFSWSKIEIKIKKINEVNPIHPAMWG